MIHSLWPCCIDINFESHMLFFESIQQKINDEEIKCTMSFAVSHNRLIERIFFWEGVNCHFNTDDWFHFFINVIHYQKCFKGQLKFFINCSNEAWKSLNVFLMIKWEGKVKRKICNYNSKTVNSCLKINQNFLWSCNEWKLSHLQYLMLESNVLI